MKTTNTINRRRFLQTGILGSTALAATTLPGPGLAAITKPDRDALHGLKLGLTSYSLRKFTLDQAIAMTRQLGMKYISLKDMHLPYKTTTAERQEARKKIEAAGLVLMGGGVIYMDSNEAEIRALFEYAKDAGLPTMVSSPEPAALDTVEKMAREYDIRVAIHNHGPGDKRYPSPLDVLRLVKDRDAHLGICLDVGHTVRLGEDPVAAIRQCASRLYDFHIKDVTQAAPKGGATEVGRGIIDIVGVLDALVRVKFAHHVALEYEAHADAPMPGLIESFAYLRGALAAMT
ncbi:MAG: sugar phosphate isomerase/epimerase family protein [Limisphaerales bacterium]